ncbi:MAG TPA: prepilin-type N-terminal cleavage/methylation domain-containing protein, partial [Gemmatimonadaceae bacterium]|nr:prepilin-type N-terminal cleavage/methylation domain-containing protein [Gemmatimonadaceae bacterium]
MRHSSRRGFTLIEVISAMTLVGFVLLGGLLLLDQIGDSSARIARESRRLSSEGNGSRLMHQLLLEASLGQDTAGV